MNDNKRHITLEPFNTGDLLSECVRAYLWGGNPSVMIRRINEGVIHFITEKERAVKGAEAGNRMEPAEREILDALQVKLADLHKAMRMLEELHYSM